jgi:hypothetical protein
MLVAAVFLGMAGCAANGNGHRQKNGEYRENGGNGADAYDAWDANNDDYLSKDEFCAGIMREGVFDKWDFNNDNVLEPEEYGNSIFEIWDENNSGYLEEAEWYEYSDSWFDRNYNFSEWDTNDDGIVSRSEFTEELDENDVLDTWNWDDDDGLDETEFCNMAYGVIDQNRNNRIDPQEWDPFYSDWF